MEVISHLPSHARKRSRFPAARNTGGNQVGLVEGRKGCKGRKPKVSFPCAADSSIQLSAKQNNLHARRSEAEPRWCSVSELAGLSFAGLSGRAAGLDLLKSLAATREFGHNRFDSCCPDKRFGFFVPGGEELVNGRD